MQEYKIISSKNTSTLSALNALSKEINKSVKQGWQISGEVQHLVKDEEITFFQRMVKEEYI